MAHAGTSGDVAALATMASSRPPAGSDGDVAALATMASGRPPAGSDGGVAALAAQADADVAALAARADCENAAPLRVATLQRIGARLRMGDLDGDGARDEMVITAPTWMGTGDWQRGDLWTIERL